MTEIGTEVHQHLEQATGTGVQGRQVLSDFEADVDGYYRKASDAQLICDAYGHEWPKLVPGYAIPAGFRATPAQEQGYLDVTEICERCDEERHSVLARGFLGDRALRRYKRPKNTLTRPADYFGSRADAQWALMQRVGIKTVLASGRAS